MRGEKIRPNDGYESVNLSPAEKAGLKPGDVLNLEDKKSDVVLLTKDMVKKKAKKEAVLPEDDFSEDEVTKVYKKPLVTAEGYLTPEGHKANSRKRVEKRIDAQLQQAEDKEEYEAEEASKRVISQDTKDALSDIGVHVKETDDALELVRETAVQSKKAKEVAEQLEDLEKIRNSIKTSPVAEESEVKKLDKEIKAGFKSADKQSVSRPKAKAEKESAALPKEAMPESEKVMNAKIFAENAIRTYSKLYIEYDPDAINKLHKGETMDDKIAALDLTAITPPPFRAIFSSKGRKLRDVYGKVQEAIKRYNDEREAS